MHRTDSLSICLKFSAPQTYELFFKDHTFQQKNSDAPLPVALSHNYWTCQRHYSAGTGVGTPLYLEQFELGGRQPGNFHLRQGLEVLVGPLTGLAPDNGHDTLLGDKELTLRQNAQRVVEPQPLHLGPVIVTTAQRLVPQPDQFFVSPFAHTANIIDFHPLLLQEVPIFSHFGTSCLRGQRFSTGFPASSDFTTRSCPAVWASTCRSCLSSRRG